jgi:flagellar assembly protein FliH
MTQPQAFSFDTEFSDSGEVLRASTWQPLKRAYAPAEVEALLAQARAETRSATLAEAEGLRAQALAAIAQTLAQSAPALQAAAERHRAEAADLAVVAARVLAGAALTRFPQGPLKTALETLAEEVEASPRLVVSAAGLDDEGRGEITRLCAEAGVQGLVVFRDEPGLPPAAFILEWADGRAAYDPAGVEARIRDAVAAALAAEAGHAEALDAPTNEGVF